MTEDVIEECAIAAFRQDAIEDRESLADIEERLKRNRAALLNTYTPMIRAVFSRLESLGYVVVPRIPTKEIIDAYYDWDRKVEREGSGDVIELYRAMIDCASSGK